MKPIRLISGVMTVGFWTLMSRILGVVREVLILGLIGPGPVMDAFVAAFRLPNMFRRFFAEGAFNAAFVPLFSKRLEADDNPLGFARDALNGLGFVLIILTAIAMIFMPALVWATAEGFVGTERFDLTVGYGRIVFPYIFFISLAALFSGALNASGRFAAAAAAPVLLNIFIIIAMLVAYQMGGEVITALIWTVPFAGIIQLAFVWVAASRAGIHLRPGLPRFTPEMRHLVVVAVPAFLAGGVMQINLIVGQLVASRFESAVGWLYAADRLYQLPLGVVGIAIGIVLLPDLSRRLKAGDEAGGRAALSRAGEMAMALTVPAAVALMVIPWPLVSVLFERGAMSADDSASIALAVMIYGVGLPAFVMQKIQQPLFFAREDTRSPFRYAVVAMLINTVLAFGLAPVIGWVAAAVATVVASWVMVLLLSLGARRYGEATRFDARARKRLGRIVIASALMGGVLWAAMLTLMPFLGMAGWRYLALLVLISVGMASYALFGQLLGAFRLSDFKAAMRRG